MEPVNDLPELPETSTSSSLTDREPVLAIVLGGTIIPSLIAVLIAFGIDLSDEQVTAVLALVASVSVTVSAFAARARAWAPTTVAKLLGR